MTCGALLLALPLAASVRGDWTPPNDGSVSENEVTGFITVVKQIVQNQKAAAASLQGQSGLAGVAVAQQLDARQKAAIKEQGMTEDEYNYVGQVVSKAKLASLRDQVKQKTKDDLEKQIADNKTKIEDLKKQLATYQAAQASGRRVLSDDDRKSAVESATNDRNAANDEIKGHTDEVKAAKDAVSKAEADQAAAEKELHHPPKFDNADDKNAFMQDKQNAIQAAKDARKEAEGNLADAEKALNESRAKADAAEARINNPDLPVTDDDKAAAKQENDEKIKDLTDQIQQLQDGNKMLQDSETSTLAAMGDDKDRPSDAVMTVFKKHEKEYDDALGMQQQK
jgi:hypothetical protein